jgi:two-component system alkaline phosphatase synthesis response regulator PhoP
MQTSVLIVEDEESIRESLKLNLELEGYDVSTVADGIHALQKIKSAYFDLIILDIMLPEMDGIALCEAVRLQQNEVPILFLSAKNSPKDRIEGLRKGGDDYLSKPFDLEELLLRIAKLIAKNKKIQEPQQNLSNYQFANGSIDFTGLTCITCDGKEINLSKREVALLKLLIDHKNEVVSREHILQVVWGYQVYPNTRTIDNFLLNFRKYFEKDSKNPVHFHSIRGIGYKFTE